MQVFVVVRICCPGVTEFATPESFWSKISEPESFGEDRSDAEGFCVGALEIVGLIIAKGAKPVWAFMLKCAEMFLKLWKRDSKGFKRILKKYCQAKQTPF